MSDSENSDNDVLNQIRKKTITKLNSIIKNKSKSSKIEESIYSYCKQLCEIDNHIFDWDEGPFKSIYLYQSDNIIKNIDVNSILQNDYLFNAIKKKQINSENIAFLKPDEMFPSHWKPILDKKNEYEKRRNVVQTTEQFTCKKCYKKKCTYYELQTRSADEPMTLFIQCVNCSNKWRQ